MMILLANGQQALECNICHGRNLPASDYVAITPEIHVCKACELYQTMSIGFFAWYVELERMYLQRGQKEVPREGRYTEDWPIRYYKQGFSPEHAFETMETSLQQTP